MQFRREFLIKHVENKKVDCMFERDGEISRKAQVSAC
jgi:hypothetical protein